MQSRESVQNDIFNVQEHSVSNPTATPEVVDIPIQQKTQKREISPTSKPGLRHKRMERMKSAKVTRPHLRTHSRRNFSANPTRRSPDNAGKPKVALNARTTNSTINI